MYNLKDSIAKFKHIVFYFILRGNLSTLYTNLNTRQKEKKKETRTCSRAWRLTLGSLRARAGVVLYLSCWSMHASMCTCAACRSWLARTPTATTSVWSTWILVQSCPCAMHACMQLSIHCDGRKNARLFGPCRGSYVSRAAHPRGQRPTT